MTITDYTCPVCTGNDIFNVITIKDVPVYCNVLYPTAEDALDAPRGDIVLTYCRRCGHIFNSAHDSSKMNYSREYENSLHYSPRFQSYAASLAKRLVETYDLRSKTVLEIGCGKGDFLNMLCELGENSGIGFDPSYEVERFPAESQKRFSIIHDFYTEKYAKHSADLIVCRHVLEHIESPRPFLNMLRKSVGSNENTILFFEVPNVMFTLKDLGIWDLIYEHCGYFSIRSISKLFRSCNFTPIEIEETFGGQYLCVEALASNPARDAKMNEHDDDMIDYVNAFSNQYYRKVDRWREKLEELNQSKKRIVIWGAGSKGVTFLNTLKTCDQIKYVADINPHKQGKYIPGMGQKIVPLEFLKVYHPEIIVVMNPIYKEEIKLIADGLDLSSDIVSA